MFKSVKITALFLALTVVLSINRPIRAGVDGSSTDANMSYAWSLAGPFGGDVKSLTIDPADPTRLYLGTTDGQIYRSSDAARSWTRLLSFNHPGYSVDKLIIDETNPKTIYAPIWLLANDTDGTIYKSTDGGDSWRELEGMRGHSVRALAIAPNNSKILIAAAIDAAYRSNDGGATWKIFSPPDHPDIKRLHSVAIDPTNTDIVYLGTEHLPWRTEDGGQTWNCIKGHPTEKKLQFIDDSDIFTILVDHQEPSHLYASACSGIYCSVDNATTWTKYQGIPFTSRRTHVIYPDATNKDIIYACTTEGLWKTTTGGQNWRPMTSLRTVVNAIAIHPSNPNRIYLGVKYGGVLVSDDGGENFHPANNGFVNRQISNILADRSIKGRIYGAVLFNGFDGGLFVSNDNGQNWRTASRGLEGQDVYTIYQSAQDEKVLFAGTNSGLYRSADRGESWLPVAAASASVAVGRSARAMSRRVGPIKINDRVTGIAPLYSGRGGLLIASWSGLYRVSEDGSGLEKYRLSTTFKGRILSVATHPQRPELIYVGSSAGIYISENNGNRFHLYGIPESQEIVPEIEAIGVSPRDANQVMIGTLTSCYFSKDAGKTWQRRGHGVPFGEAQAIQFSNVNPSIVAVGIYKDGGVYLSTDGGENFQRIDRELPSQRISAISFDNFDPHKIYIGSFSGGIYLLNAANIVAAANH